MFITLLLVSGQFQIFAQLAYMMLPSQLAVVGWFRYECAGDRHTAATNVNPKRFIIPTFLIVIPKNQSNKNLIPTETVVSV